MLNLTISRRRRFSSHYFRCSCLLGLLYFCNMNFYILVVFIFVFLISRRRRLSVHCFRHSCLLLRPSVSVCLYVPRLSPTVEMYGRMIADVLQTRLILSARTLYRYFDKKHLLLRPSVCLYVPRLSPSLHYIAGAEQKRLQTLCKQGKLLL